MSRELTDSPFVLVSLASCYIVVFWDVGGQGIWRCCWRQTQWAGSHSCCFSSCNIPTSPWNMFPFHMPFAHQKAFKVKRWCHGGKSWTYQVSRRVGLIPAMNFEKYLNSGWVLGRFTTVKGMECDAWCGRISFATLSLRCCHQGYWMMFQRARSTKSWKDSYYNVPCHLKRDHVKRNIVFQPSFFRGHVSFQGCKYSEYCGNLPSWALWFICFHISIWIKSWPSSARNVRVMSNEISPRLVILQQ